MSLTQLLQNYQRLGYNKVYDILLEEEEKELQKQKRKL